MVRRTIEESPDTEARSSVEERAVYAEQVKLLYENSRSAFTATLVNGLLVVFLQRTLVPAWILAGWLFAVLLVTGLRVLLLRVFRRRSPSPKEIGPWVRYFLAAVSLSGALWGVAGLLLFRPESLAHQAFLAFVLGGMVAGAAGTYAPLPAAYFAFSVPTLLPITVSLVAAGDELAFVMAGMVAIFFAMMALVAARGRRVILTSLRLRFENAGLVEVLREEKERVHRINEELGAEVAERERSEEELARHRDHLQQLVAERTAGLTEAYEQLRRAKVEWEKTFDAVPDLIALIDPDSRIRRLNRAFAERIGVDPREAVGLRCCRALHGTEDPPQDCPHAMLLADRAQHEGEVYSQAHGRYYLVSASPLHRPEGEFLGSVLVARDITHLKRIEGYQHLEALGVLAGGIAHDFNNILTAIAGNIYRARDSGAGPDKRLQYLTRAEDACFQAQGLTRQLLTFARGGEPVRKVFDLGKALSEWVGFALRGSSIRAEVDVAPDLKLLEADERQVRQVVSNLVINAQQAMPGGGVVRVNARNETVEPGAASTLAPGTYVVLCVQDEGPGISPEHLPRLFHPYFTTKAGGTGLGLSTAYSIVKRHGGELEARSKLGEGATFCVHLPASEKVHPPAEPPPAVSRSGSGRLLVMDDEEAIRELLADVLPQLGYEAEFAADGAEAVELYRKAAEDGRPFDGVVLDLTVPGGMGGKETLERLRALAPGVKAIASSGYAADPILSEPARFGFADVIAKPYRIADLARVLSRVLSAPAR
ncbi:MAG: PAS domain-containing protein [Deltaproteobacteria bacterium]|nr:PAS domain-containing protein [Deltaproteobacteria bacterium]